MTLPPFYIEPIRCNKKKLVKRLTQKNLGGGIYGIQLANFVFGGTTEKLLAEVTFSVHFLIRL